MGRLTVLCVVAFAAGLSAAPVPVGAGKLAPPTPAQLMQSQNNLKQIALAVINSSDTNNGRMPTDIRSKDGKPLLSWRVAILPFMEEGPLHQQFKLDEPWDSEHNKKLIGKMPKVYAPVRVTAKDGMTFYQVFAGDGALFGPKAQPLYPASILDGTANTGLVFEAGEPVPWTKPADLAFDAKKPLPKLGGLFDGGFHVGMCDGSVMRCRKDADEAELKKLITPAEGEVINFDKLEAK
jgi:hypothetical protein